MIAPLQGASAVSGIDKTRSCTEENGGPYILPTVANGFQHNLCDGKRKVTVVLKDFNRLQEIFVKSSSASLI